MKIRYCIPLYGLILFCVLVWNGNALASGIGFYVQGGGGTAEWEADDLRGQFDFDSDSRHGGLGIVYDSNVSQNSLFNYRAYLGYERAVHDPDNDFGDIKLDSIVFDQDFGFGLYRSGSLRLWVGPEVRISYSSGRPDDADDLKFKLFGIGAGPVAGVNFHINSTLSLCLKGGFLGIGYIGEVDDDSDSIDGEDYEMDQGYAFFNFAVIFKFNDQYDRSEPVKKTTF